jgi:hypothetical protein
VSRRLYLSLLSTLLVVGLPAAAMAQDETTDAAPMWDASVKIDALDVSTFGDGFILVGGRDKKPLGKVWTSPDGTTWSRIEDDAIFEGAILRRVTPFGDGVVVLGNQGRKLVSWYSPDGATWQKTTVDKVGQNLELFPEAITDGPAGIIAVASVVGQDLVGQRFYGSPDGQAWDEIEPPSPTAPGIFVSLESTDDEYFAVARPMFTPDTDLYWRSTDGVSWETFEGPADGTLHDLAIGADGTFVGVGQQADTFTAAIWRADELGSWELVYSAPSNKETEERLDVVAVGGPGFLAGGSTSSCPDQPDRYCPTASILASDDGREWRALGVEDGVPGPLHETSLSAIAADSDTTVMVAWHADRPSEVWTVPTAP